MKHLFICLVLILTSNILYAQEIDSCNILVAQSKIFKHKSYIFHSGMYTSMKLNNDSIFIIPKILYFSNNQIFINKRIYIDDDNIRWKKTSFPVSSIKWINWDGVPRKKVRALFYNLTVQQSVNKKYCK